MASCPKCGATMGQMDVVCPKCGYDFPDPPVVPRVGIAYSKLADLALMVGGVWAGLASLGFVASGVMALADARYLEAFVVAPTGFFLCLAFLVVCIRIQNV
jgi:hypothetical protein